MYNMMGGPQQPFTRYNMGIPGGGFSFDSPMIQTPGGMMNLGQPQPLLGSNQMAGLASMLGQQMLKQSQPEMPQTVPQMPQRQWAGWQTAPWLQRFMSRNRMGG